MHSRKRYRFVCFSSRLLHTVLIGFLLLNCFSYVLLPRTGGYKNSRIADISFAYTHGSPGKSEIRNMERLVTIREGDRFSLRAIRRSMENIFRLGSFSNIEIRLTPKKNSQVALKFILHRKLKILNITYRHSLNIRKSQLKNSIFSLRQGEYYKPSDLKEAAQEIRAFLDSRGYFNPRIQHETSVNLQQARISIKFHIRSGSHTRLKRIDIAVNNPDMQKQFKALLDGNYYIPVNFQKKIARIRNLLKKQFYFFPDISVKENFLSPDRSQVNISIHIVPGFRYKFDFRGMKPRMNLISSVWENKVFEKWAEKESRARILNYLKNQGYLNARVESSISEKNNTKNITFNVKKNQRYALEQVQFFGNRALSDKQLKRIIKTDDQLYDRIFHLRSRSLQVDLEILKLYYYFQGFPQATVRMIPAFRNNRAYVKFLIREGDRIMVESVLLRGNSGFPSDTLKARMKTRAGGPFVQQQFNEDIQRLEEYYLKRGYKDVKITPEISQGKSKSVLISINEGRAFKTGNLIIIGASAAQTRLLRSLFPLENGAPFNRNQINVFKSELENSPIFSSMEIEEIEKKPAAIDILLKTRPDYGHYYGFGLGWEDRRGYRGTLEYQEQNFLKSCSSFSALLQLGPMEQQAVVSLDTPYFLKSRLNSSTKFWIEDQAYPSYKFKRMGIGQSIIKTLGTSTYISASLKWYRTKLTELEMTPFKLDQVNKPFDTTSFSLLYVVDKRNDPFNPVKGDFFSSNIKIGFPLLQKEYSFFKFSWSYQKNMPLLKHGSLSFSVRNGFAAGDMSITERFFAGGIHTFRGSSNDRLGPIDSNTLEPVGGNAMILFNVEATQPLAVIPIENLYYCVFADIGNIFSHSSDFTLKKLETALGFGIKYKTPLGPLRIDFGWNLRGRRAEKNFLIKIGIGNVF